MKVLELFSGTGSVGAVARERGHQVVSIENDPCFKATYCEDILTFDFTTLETPDFIWASPPCTTFSILTNSHKPRPRNKDGVAQTESALEGDKLLHRTMYIISYFLAKNPKLFYVIENPRAYMRKQPCLQNVSRSTTSYNHFGFPYRKPTDFFSNFVLDLPLPAKKEGDYTLGTGSAAPAMKALAQITGVKESPKKAMGRIPPALVHTIFDQMG